MSRRYVLKLLVLSSLFMSSCEKNQTQQTDQNCKLPAKYEKYSENFLINQNLNCSANVFIHIAGAMALDLMKQHPTKALEEIGRVHYEKLADEFEGDVEKISTNDSNVQARDNHKIPVRFYNKDKKNIIFYIHGGGWSRGNIRTHDALCKKLSQEFDCQVVALDYRLAPENKYPKGLNDAEDVYKFILKNLQPSQIILAGDSAGGNMASCLTIKLIKQKAQIPNQLLLIYPSLDLRIKKSTDNKFDSGYLLTRDSINYYVTNYLGTDTQLANSDEVSPILTSNEILKKFPSTTIVSAQFDPLTVEANKFTKRLKENGVDCQHLEVPKTIHIFAQFFGIFKEETKQMLDFIKDKLFINNKEKL
jgi:acetyl esterase